MDNDPVLSPVCKCTCGYTPVKIADVKDEVTCSAKAGKKCTVTDANGVLVFSELRDCAIRYEESSTMIDPGVFNGGGLLMP
jgi:hypothetical protein